VKTDTAAILDDTGTAGVVVASGSKSGYSLASDQSGVTIGTVNALASGAISAIWAAAISGLTTAGSIGEYILDHIVGVLTTGNHSPQSGDALP
jgi:hypothetical protein